MTMTQDLPLEFKLVKTLAKNKFSNSFLCKNSHQKLFVLKELKTSPSILQIEVLNKLNQINSFHLQKSDFITHNRKTFIIRPYIEGKDLKTILKSTFLYSRFSKQFFIKLFIEIFNTLQLLHDNGIFHADIKPANILLSPQANKWNYKNFFILDFERAILADQTVNYKNKNFSLIYSPPEQLLSYNHLYNSSLDTFATCITLLEVLTNKKPLYDCNAEILINLQLTYPIPKPTKFDESLFEILKKGIYKERFPKPPNQLYYQEINEILTKGINQRIKSPELIALELQKWLTEQPVLKEKWFSKLIRQI